MAEEKSPEDLLAEHIRDMGEDLGRIYDALSSDVAWLHIKWNLYRQLYAHSAKRVDVLNQTAGHFFGVLQRALLDDVLLHLARLTDPPRTAGRLNLTIRQLPEHAPANAASDVTSLVDEALIACGPARKWRNRRLAHNDFELLVTSATGSADPLPGISRSDVEAALLAIRKPLNRLATHFWGSTTMYEEAITPLGDGDALVRHLVAGLRERARRLCRLREGKAPLPDDVDESEGGAK